MIVLPLLLLVARAAAKPPHIVFFLMDDFGWNDVSMHGSAQIPTPTIDSLAAAGVRLNNYYVNPVCSPTRASLMSGRSIIHHGVYTPFGAGNYAEGLNLTYTLLPEHLKAEFGYRTFMIGKWHLGMKTAEYLPSRRGFDRYFGYYSGVMDYWTHGGRGPWPHSGGLDLHLGGSDFNITEGDDEAVYDTHGVYSNHLFAAKAAEWIADYGSDDGPDGAPLFMYFAFQGCHSGDNSFVQAPEDKIDNFDAISPNKTCGSWQKPLTGECTKAAMRKSVAACVSSADDAVGTVVDALVSAKMYADTLIVLSTDNGGPTDAADNNNMNNFPLRGCKGGYFDGGMRGVGLMHGSGLDASVHGTVSDQLHHVTDWLPTLLSAAKSGVTGTPHTKVRTRVGEVPFKPGDGIDNWQALSTGGLSARSEIIHVVQAEGSVLDAHAIRSGDLKLLWHPAGTDCSVTHPGWYPPPGLAWNYTTHFTVKCSEPPSSLDACTKSAPCLFNITADPCEHYNLAVQMPEAVATLSQKIEGYRKTAVLPWLNFKGQDPRAEPTNLGPNKGGYQGVFGPWMPKEEDTRYYPTNYSGPGY